MVVAMRSSGSGVCGLHRSSPPAITGDGGSCHRCTPPHGGNRVNGNTGAVAGCAGCARYFDTRTVTGGDIAQLPPSAGRRCEPRCLPPRMSGAYGYVVNCRSAHDAGRADRSGERHDHTVIVIAPRGVWSNFIGEGAKIRIGRQHVHEVGDIAIVRAICGEAVKVGGVASDAAPQGNVKVAHLAGTARHIGHQVWHDTVWPAAPPGASETNHQPTR